MSAVLVRDHLSVGAAAGLTRAARLLTGLLHKFFLFSDLPAIK